MRYARLLIVAIALVLASSAVSAFAAVPKTNIPIDGDAVAAATPIPRQLGKDEAKAAIAALGDPYLHDGREPDLVLTMFDWDPAHAGPHVVPFWKEASGAHSDVYVGWNDLTPPATSSQQDHLITSEQIQYMSDEFDSRI
ncbi:MAG TPA: hypothetical protein VLA05_08425, partial [Coriobacteriia bacterium]|nr:hypothetical protein [Coriobacteriia bacterium]